MGEYKIKLGWKPSVPDHRDYKFSFSTAKIDLPNKVDLRNKIRNIFRQDFNDCVANSTSNLISSLDHDTQYIKYIPSRLYIYYNARSIDGSQCFDEGCMIRNAMKTLSRDSFVSEESFRYIPQNVFIPPSLQVYDEAKRNKVHIQCYRNITNTEYNIKYVLSQGHIIIFGAMLYESFTNLDSNYKVPEPDIINEKLLGGHCMLIYGYDDDTKCFYICNSWGNGWGDDGFHKQSYKYVCSNLCDDFWVIENINKI